MKTGSTQTGQPKTAPTRCDVKAGGGKSKGAAFERLVCTALSLWISDGKRDDLYWRSSMSGGRATVAFKKGGENRTQCGDITAIHPDGNALTDRCLISCKFYQDLKIAGTVTGSTKAGLTSFWLECLEEAKRYNKLPVLIAKQNNVQPFICLNDAGVANFQVKGHYLALLPLGGGVQILWLDRFLKHAVRPGAPGIVRQRPRIKGRPA